MFLWHVAPASIIFYRFRRYVSFSVANTIATALITSRLDYCNSLLYNIASKDILKLHCVQNYLARFVTRSPRCSHSVPLLKSLHCVPVQSHIIFKFCTIAHQTLSSWEPSYLFSMLFLAPKSRYSVTCFSLAVCPEGQNSCWDVRIFTCCPYSLKFTLWTF